MLFNLTLGKRFKSSFEENHIEQMQNA